jgi:hypothetical protein
MNQQSEPEMVTIEEVTCSAEGWRRTLDANGNSRFVTLNARAVEFIAKPGMIRDLRICIRENVMAFLKLERGFSSAIVLTSHKEPRLILVLTFWKTEKTATNSHWENARAVRRMLDSLIDVCTRVHTYEAALPKLSAAELPETELQIC